MSEPDFLSQNGDLTDGDEKHDWYTACAREAEARGATWHRFSYHPDNKNLILYEGWKIRPDDQGEPRFCLIAIPANQPIQTEETKI